MIRFVLFCFDLALLLISYSLMALMNQFVLLCGVGFAFVCQVLTWHCCFYVHIVFAVVSFCTTDVTLFINQYNTRIIST